VSIPHQEVAAERGTRERTCDPEPWCGPDPLLGPDPAVAADAAASECLLRCWARETDALPPAPGEPFRIVLGGGIDLAVPVRYWSPSGWHRFGRPRLVASVGEAGEAGAGFAVGGDGPATGRSVDAVALAALLSARAAELAPAGRASDGRASGRGASDERATAERVSPEGSAAEGAVATDAAPAARGCAGSADLAGRVADSVRRVALHIAARRSCPEPPPGTSAFLDAEQALLLGHPFHPTPKSREGLGDPDSPAAAAFSPELRGAFHPHWFAVDEELAAQDSALDRPADILLGGLRGQALPAGRVLLPVHPWQAREVTQRPEVAALIETGALLDLGPCRESEPWYPTSSLRTVHQPGAPFMLKLSLGVRITNSRRENLRKELLRGTEVHRLLAAGLADRWRAAQHELGTGGFDIVRDPAWLAVDVPGLRGLDVVLRDNAFGPHDRTLCLAGLVAERPWEDPAGAATVGSVRDRGNGTTAVGGRPAPSRLGGLIGALARRSARPAGAVAVEWFLRYLDRVVLPMLWLDGRAGIALEAHQQNTLVLIDADGWPAGGRYRDNQGYYFRASHAAELDALLPGVGRESDTFVPDEIADERFAYYLGINHILGLVGALGSQGLADEEVLLAALRRFLGTAARSTGSALPALLLDGGPLRCKANLLTRVHGLDELVGPVATQSVYVSVRNPVAGAADAGGGPCPPGVAGTPGSPGAPTRHHGGQVRSGGGANR